MEYFILIYCPGRSNIRQEEAEANLWVMVNRINRNKILWCENYAQKQEDQPQFKFKHYVFLNENTVITVAAFKKIYGNNSIEVIYTFYILTCSI